MMFTVLRKCHMQSEFTEKLALDVGLPPPNSVRDRGKQQNSPRVKTVSENSWTVSHFQ